jgi:palmitoyltransferase
MTAYDAFLVSVACWATLQLSWTSILLASQFWQIARQMTTLEVSNLGRYGFMVRSAFDSTLLSYVEEGCRWIC